MNKLSVGQRLAILVGLPLASIVILVYWAVSSFFEINQGVGRIYDDRVVPLTQLKRVSDGYKAIIDSISQAEAGLMTPDKAVIAINSSRKAISENWKNYTEGNLNDQERAVVKSITGFFAPADEKIQETQSIMEPMGETMELDDEGDPKIVGIVAEMYELTGPISSKITEVIELQLKLAKEEREDARTVYESARNFMITMAIIVGAIMVSFGATVARSISGPLGMLRRAMETADRNRDLTINVREQIQQSDEIGQVAAAYQGMMDRFNTIIGDVRNTCDSLQSNATSLTSTTQATRQGVAIQTRETDLVAAASTEMTHAIEEVSRNARQAASAAESANAETESGNKIIDQTIATIHALADRIRDASTVIHRVQTDSAAIGSVLDVIRGIAEQTNLLALNAAIEAARAGEQGRGFAVVADEVRSLAQRTQESTAEIQNMIQRLQNGAKEAVRTMADSSEEMERTVTQAARAGESLVAISSAVAVISDMNSQIAHATDEQKSVSQEISRNVVNISDVAKSSEHSVQDVERASNELTKLASRLGGLVNEFRTR